jgi:hypothetical protein
MLPSNIAFSQINFLTPLPSYRSRLSFGVGRRSGSGSLRLCRLNRLSLRPLLLCCFLERTLLTLLSYSTENAKRAPENDTENQSDEDQDQDESSVGEHVGVGEDGKRGDAGCL